MLILLPPSEGKAVGHRGKALDLSTLSFPDLAGARSQMIAALVDLCSVPLSASPAQREKIVAAAAKTLGIGHTQWDQVDLNAELLTAPTLRADRLYTGVLYDALNLADLPTDARRRATRWLGITSSLFGMVRINDALPSYRLPGGTTLPGVGSVAAHWRSALTDTMEAAAHQGLLIDLRSSTYAAFWRPSPEVAARTATVRVLHEVNGQRKVVSHFNKATKGRIVRALLVDGGTPQTPTDLADHLATLGWTVEVGAPSKNGLALDVIVSEL